MDDARNRPAEQLRAVSNGGAARDAQLEVERVTVTTPTPLPAQDGEGEARGAPPSFFAQAPIPAKNPAPDPLPDRAITVADRKQELARLRAERLAAELETCRRVDDKIRRKSQRILDYAASAAVLDDSGLPVVGELDERGVPKGWSKVRYNVAKDARKPLKQQPGYLAMMARMQESYKRIDAAKAGAPELNLNVEGDVRVFIDTAKKSSRDRYGVIDVTPKDEDGK